MNVIAIKPQTQKASGILAEPYHGLVAFEASDICMHFGIVLGNDTDLPFQPQSEGKVLGYGK